MFSLPSSNVGGTKDFDQTIQVPSHIDTEFKRKNKEYKNNFRKIKTLWKC